MEEHRFAQSFWKGIWSSRVPGSAKFCVWKMCQNILPTLDRLTSRHVVLDSLTCPLCNGADESNVHIGRDCSFTQSVLRTDQCLADVCFHVDIEYLGFKEWLQFCWKHLTKGSFASLIMLIWGVWKERNCRVWENKSTQACDVALMISIRLGDFLLHNSETSVPSYRRNINPKWSPPPVGCLKVNIDGAFVGQTKRGGWGFVVRDLTGLFLEGSCKSLSNIFSAEHAELLACQVAISHIIEHSLSLVIIETDSLVVQQQLSASLLPNSSVIGRLYDDVRADLALIPGSRLCHTKRSANNAAHLLAKYSSSSGCNSGWSLMPPGFLYDVLKSEQLSS